MEHVLELKNISHSYHNTEGETPALKDLCNYRKGGNKGFETVITRLQMQTYITVADFEYRKDKNGRQQKILLVKIERRFFYR